MAFRPPPATSIRHGRLTQTSFATPHLTNSFHQRIGVAHHWRREPRKIAGHLTWRRLHRAAVIPGLRAAKSPEPMNTTRVADDATLPKRPAASRQAMIAARRPRSPATQRSYETAGRTATPPRPTTVVIMGSGLRPIGLPRNDKGGAIDQENACRRRRARGAGRTSGKTVRLALRMPLRRTRPSGTSAPNGTENRQREQPTIVIPGLRVAKSPEPMNTAVPARSTRRARAKRAPPLRQSAPRPAHKRPRPPRNPAPPSDMPAHMGAP
jgi:hypothetical protein